MSRFDGAVTAHIPHLRRYARALTGDLARADDLVQDTLERAWIKFHLWQPGRDLRPWLFSIMHNVFVNQVRSAARRAPVAGGAEDLEGIPTPGNQTDFLELRDLCTCLEQVPPDQREVLLLVSLEDMSYSQVSRILDIPIGTVMSRLSRARARLRAAMSGQADGAALKVVK